VILALTTVWHGVGAPWDDVFMRRALIEVALMALCGGALGCWIVFYELAFAAETLPHAMFPGLVGAALLGTPIVIGGAVGLLVAGAAVAIATRMEVVGRDTAVAVVFTSFFGLGALMALSPQSPPGISDLLFGDILGLADSDLLLAAALVVVVLVGLRVLHARLLAVALDPLGARGLGASPPRIHLALMTLTALAVLVTVQAMGNLFVVATLVAPAAAARPLARRVSTMLVIAIGIGLLAGVGGLYLSYYASVAGGAAIAGLDVALYAASLIVSAVYRRRVPRRGDADGNRSSMDRGAAA
jgi:ABC-type Mn2+/Zn2+ transport system permease subunit